MIVPASMMIDRPAPLCRSLTAVGASAEGARADHGAKSLDDREVAPTRPGPTHGMAGGLPASESWAVQWLSGSALLCCRPAPAAATRPAELPRGWDSILNIRVGQKARQEPPLPRRAAHDELRALIQRESLTLRCRCRSFCRPIVVVVHLKKARKGLAPAFAAAHGVEGALIEEAVVADDDESVALRPEGANRFRRVRYRGVPRRVELRD
mmetsp:Transcript_21242/g.62759  ORF Transcript_21242/g.62759 Transcript_21242/m.62759 type:complete len:210 (-) Transcript_21242:966-1595(-)